MKRETSVFGCFLWMVMSFAFSGVSQTSSGELQNVELKDLANLPPVSMGFGFQGSFSNDADTDYAARLQELQSQPDGTVADATRYYEIGNAEGKLGNEQAEEAAFEKSIELFKKRIAEQSEDANAHRGLALSLAGTGQDEEAEPAFRKAVELDPEDWENWNELGAFLRDRALKVLITPAAERFGGGKVNFQFEAIIRDLLANPRTEEEYHQSTDLLNESEASLDKSIEINSSEFDPFSNRAYTKWLRLALAEIRSDSSDIPTRGKRAMAAIVDETVIADFRKAALNPEASIGFIVTASAYELMGELQTNPVLQSFENPFTELPSETRDSILNTISRLKAIAESPSEKSRYEALEGLAILQYLSGQKEESLKNALLALEQNPSSDQAWEIALGALITNKDFDRIIELTLERLEADRTSSKNHLIVAKAYIYKDEWGKAQPHIVTAMTLDRENPRSLLAGSALAIRLAENTDDLDSAMNMVGKAYSNLQRGTGVEGPDDAAALFSNVIKQMAIIGGLTGRTEEANNLVEKVFERFPDDEEAKEIQKILRAE